jgi:hypothetical protein
MWISAQNKSPAWAAGLPCTHWTTPELTVGFLLLARLLLPALLLLTRLLAGILALLAGLVVLVLLAVHSESPLLNLARTNARTPHLVAGNLCSFIADA